MNTIVPQHHHTGDSPLHRLDARVKLIAALLLILGIVATPERAWAAYPMLWTVIGCIAAIGSISVWRLGRRAGLALPFALAAVTLLVTTPGQTIMTVAGLHITDTGLARFVGIILKSWLSVQVALLLSLSTPFTDILRGLEGLHVPATVVNITSLMYRYLYVLKDESQRLLTARAARSGAVAGAKRGGTLLWRARVTGGMVGNLFLRSYERSERVYFAMLARGYDGRLRHQPMPPLTWRMVSAGAVPVLTVLLIQIVVRL